MALRNPAFVVGGAGLLLALTAVPFVAREGEFLVVDSVATLTGAALAPQFPLFWCLLALGAVWLTAGFFPIGRPHRLALWGGLSGFSAVLWLVFSAGSRPYAFGPGALLALVVCLVVLAFGLSQGGFIRADTFVASSILLLAFFVLLFVLFPILAVMQNSVMDSRGFRPGLFVDTLWNYKAFWRVLGNSLWLAVFVGVVSTVIGLAFALAATRSQSRLTVLLRSFSLLPLITPPFVVGLAIILLFGLQGFVTSTLLGLQTRGIFGFPGLALAQILSFSPVAFLVIASVVESVNPALKRPA